MAKQKYFGEWSNLEDVKNDFFPSYRDQRAPANFPTDREMIVASYHQGGYEGSAMVVYRQKGKLYEVGGSHCSCYGLEDQWEPEETSVKAILMRTYPTAVMNDVKKALEG